MILSASQFEAIQKFDTCTIANAIEQFGTRLRNEGFTRPGLRCVTHDDVRVLGYAATCRVRFSNPSVTGAPYADRIDWWSAMDRLPQPRIAVIQDEDPEPISGAAVGEVHAAILQALHCSGVVTNGAVRDIAAVKKLGLPMFARLVGVSHSYMNLIEYGKPVEIMGLKVQSGDLLYADCHGVISIPSEIAAELPEAAARTREKERRIVQVCLSPHFSTERLLNAIQDSAHDASK
jgi:4-hydroxy-4-methyl-2-oxoglutarate aldolase